MCVYVCWGRVGGGLCDTFFARCSSPDVSERWVSNRAVGADRQYAANSMTGSVVRVKGSPRWKTGGGECSTKLQDENKNQIHAFFNLFF